MPPSIKPSATAKTIIGTGDSSSSAFTNPSTIATMKIGNINPGAAVITFQPMKANSTTNPNMIADLTTTSFRVTRTPPPAVTAWNSASVLVGSVPDASGVAVDCVDGAAGVAVGAWPEACVYAERPSSYANPGASAFS